ncbi:MAG: metal-dependent transcriptional regulator, partial [Anaerolineales bacterium]|nr:metal-dependent transcriptional regulator [Anaerolineales bacterium]
THVPISALAQRLGVSPISATERVHRLQDKAQLDHRPYQGVRLTRQGRSTALMVIRRHRLWECFLFGHLGLAWDQVHEIACQLEHAVGGPVANSLETFLEEPVTCPHGNPIPSRGSALRPSPGVPLSDLAPGQQAIVLRIEPESTEVLTLLDHHGLRPGARLSPERPPAPAGLVRLQIGGRSARVPIEATRHVIVAVRA